MSVLMRLSPPSLRGVGSSAIITDAVISCNNDFRCTIPNERFEEGLS